MGVAAGSPGRHVSQEGTLETLHQVPREPGRQFLGNRSASIPGLGPEAQERHGVQRPLPPRRPVEEQEVGRADTSRSGQVGTRTGASSTLGPAHTPASVSAGGRCCAHLRRGGWAEVRWPSCRRL